MKNFLVAIILVGFACLKAYSQNELDKTNCIPGTIGGNIDVSPSGAATYKLPIVVSPGSNGMQPTLNIVYNSQSGNGLLGWGWDLEGLSYIFRANKNVYYNGFFDDIKYSSQDNFELDGVRLILSTVTGTYNPANNPYIKITFSGNSFTLISQNGLKMEYGGTPGSTLTAGNTDTPLAWAISKITDTNGNFIEFYYTNDNASGEQLISEIKYTGNSFFGKQPYNSIKFFYKERKYVEKKYISNGLLTKSRLLSSIKMYCEEQLSKSYEFEYSYDIVDKLNKISFSENNTKYNSTYISWKKIDSNVVLSDNIPNTIPINLWGKDNYFGQTFFGDFNGDGIADIARVDSAYSSLLVGINTGNGYSIYSINLPTNNIVRTSDEDYSSIVETNKYTKFDIQIVDYNNDYKDEILYHYSKNQEIAYTPRPRSTSAYFHSDKMLFDIVDQLQFNGTGIVTSNTFYEAPVNQIVKTKFFYGDIDNDGKMNRIILKDGRIVSITNIPSSALPSLNSISEIYIADFNGDQQKEILVQNSSNYFCYKYGNSSLIWQKQLYINNNFDYFLTGDINGDGQVDLLGKSKKTSDGFSDWIAYLSGNGSTVYITSLPDNPYEYAIILDDINNDGKSEIIYSENNIINISSYTGAPQIPFNVISTIKSSYIDKISILKTVDIDNDGTKELLYGKLSINTPLRCVKLNDSFTGHFYVDNIIDGLGNISTFNYRYQVDNRIFSSSTPKPEYPLSLNRGPFYVVNSLKTENNGKLLNSLKFTYSDGYNNLQGLGFLGFKQFKKETTHLLNNVVNTTNYSYTLPGNNSIFYIWVSSQSTTKGGTLISSESQSLRTIGGDLSKKLFLPYVYSTTSSDHVNSAITTTSNIYNSINGMLEKQVVEVGGFTTVNNIQYSLFSDGIYRPTQVKIDKTHGSDTRTNVETYNYGGNQFLLQGTVSSNSNYTISTTYNNYDSYGNPTNIVVSDGTFSRETGLKYDNYGRFIETTTNAKGYKFSTSFRGSDGAKLSTTDQNNLVTRFDYIDGGNTYKTVVTYPDGKTSTTTLCWDETENGSLYKVLEEPFDGKVTKMYYNSSGQLVCSKSLGMEGKEIVKTIDYNLDGSIKMESNSAVDINTTYSYDYLGRLKGIDGKNINKTYSYGVRSQVEVDNLLAVSLTKNFDEAGHLTSVTGTNGTVEYLNYTGHGKVGEIKTNSTSIIMKYDDFGNKLSLKDPNTGLITYNYNGFGELVKQKDGKNQETTFSYDNIGRLISVVGSGMNGYAESYSFYESGNLKGMPESVTRNGVTEKYYYDAYYKKIKSSTTSADGYFEISYKYDANNRIFQVVHPTGLTLEYGYDSGGYICKISGWVNNTNNLIWERTSINEQQQTTGFLLGNGLTTKRVFNSKSWLECIKTGKAPNYTNIQNISYGYDSRGMMVSRAEGSRLETFTYDNITRLTSSTVAGEDTVSYKYHENGNIESTSLTGKYTYQSAIPHAVVAVDNLSGMAQQLSSFGITCSYTSDNRIAWVSNGISKNSFTYAPSGNRFKVEYYNGSTLDSSKIYVGTSELVLNGAKNKITSRTFVYAPTGACAVWERGSTGEGKFYYIHTDHLGSWLAVTDQTGTVKNRYSYDAWGRPRNPTTWEVLPQGAGGMRPMFGRGYTGHEHMAEFGLINMNGRLYDPCIQRFLSPDPLVVDPANAQGYNRYSYCLNNPLAYTDPSGYRVAKYLPDPVPLGGYTSITLPEFRPGGGGGLVWTGAVASPVYADLYFRAVVIPVQEPSFYRFGVQGSQYGYWVKEPVWGSGGIEYPNGITGDGSIAEVGICYRFVPVGGGEPAGQGGEPLPSWLSWTNNSVNTVSYGATVVGGSTGVLNSGAIRYYSNAWKGNQYIKTFNLTKLGTGVGVGTSIIGGGIGLYNFYGSDRSWGDYGQLAVSLLSSGLTLSGYTAPIGIGIGFIDVAGGFNGFYNYLDTQQQLYNSTGGVMLPVNGTFTFIPLRRP